MLVHPDAPEPHDLTPSEVADGVWLLAAIAANTSEPPPPAEPPVSPRRFELPATAAEHSPPMEEPERPGVRLPPELPEPARVRTDGTDRGTATAGGLLGSGGTPTAAAAPPLPDVSRLVRAFRAFNAK